MTSTSRTDSAARSIHASPDQVYAAFLDPGALETWLPPEGATGVVKDMDARVGGGFTVVLHFADPVDPKTSSRSDASRVTFAELEPGRLVVQRVRFETSEERFTGVMRMTWQLEPEENGTRVTVTATDVPVGIGQEDHEAGLASSLAHLAAHLEG